MTVVINGTTGIDTGTGSLVAADATTPTYLDLFEDTDNGSNYVRLIAPTSVASNRTITLPDGTGTVAVNNVSGVLVSGTVNGGAANPLSGGTSVDFTGIPSWVKRITVMFDGVSVSGTSPIQVQIGDSGGLEITGYSGAVVQHASSANNTTSFSAGFQIAQTGLAAGIEYGFLTLVNVTGNTWCAGGTINLSGQAMNSVAGAKTLSGTLTQVSITTVGGANTFDAGTINILYE